MGTTTTTILLDGAGAVVGFRVGLQLDEGKRVASDPHARRLEHDHQVLEFHLDG